MKREELKELKANHDSFIDTYKKAGNEVAVYICPHCKSKVETPKPRSKDECSKKGYWDSGKTCPECGAQNFVIVYPTGETNSALVNAPEIED